MFTNKSILARLLANENISVVQGNFRTASFNVESRVLQLPMWKEMTTDVYDLLVGHEVAHALWTPRENLVVEGVPFSFVNVVEDIRIEKKVLRKYPGLVSNFSRGYLDLIERDIFDTQGQDLNAMSFMDRLNLKAKGREHVNIEFSDEERYYVDRAMSVESFDDVKAVVREIADWLKEKQEDNQDQNQNEVVSDTHESSEFADEQAEELENEESSADATDGSDDAQGEAESDGDSKESDQGQPQESVETSSESSNEASDDSSEESPDIAKKTEDKNDSPFSDCPLADVSTDVAQHQNSESLVQSDTLFLQGIPRSDYERVLIRYPEILKSRRSIVDLDSTRSEYEEFLKESKPVVNMMVKEFEMRKAAYRSLRARTSNKGSLDVNKIHSYKYNDQLFKQVTTLADGKNHGMIMLIDYSGSMNGILSAVIRQTINLVQFCKRVNIPFRVLAFTSTGHYTQDPRIIVDNSLSRFDYSDLRLVELFSEKMSKRDYEYAMSSFFARTRGYRNCSDKEELGSTPLNSALMALKYVFEDFKRDNPVHKLNLVTLTDGASNCASFSIGDDFSGEVRDIKKIVVDVSGKKIDIPPRAYDAQAKVTRDILEAVTGPSIRKINYFITEANGVWGLVSRDVIDCDNSYLDRYNVSEKTKSVKRAVKSDGVYVNDNKKLSGYDRQFILVQRKGTYRRPADFIEESSELEVPDGATTRQLAKAFSKFGDAKKKSRIITRKFAEMVA